jgi:hypothetical protein
VAGGQTVVVRRFSAASGVTAQALALPGTFAVSALAASANPSRPLLYLARAGADGQVYVLSADATGPTPIAQVPLGGPAGAAFAGQVTLSPTADGSQVYVSADVTATDGPATSHDIWLVDSASGTVASHRIAFLAAGQVLANWSGGASGQVFSLLGSQVVLLPRDLALAGDPPAWLRLKDGLPVVRLVGTGADAS